MKRSGFLATLAAIPLLGRMGKKKTDTDDEPKKIKLIECSTNNGEVRKILNEVITRLNKQS